MRDWAAIGAKAMEGSADPCPWCGSTTAPFARVDRRPRGGVIEDCGACGLPRNRPEDALAIVAKEAHTVRRAADWQIIVNGVADAIGMAPDRVESLLTAGCGFVIAKLTDDPHTRNMAVGASLAALLDELEVEVPVDVMD